VSLVVCLDSGCGTYDRLWTTTSLRGLVAATVRADVLTEGVHSGAASGIVPSSFRILRQLLTRVEDEATGRVLVPELHVEIPGERLAQAAEAARVLGAMHEGFPLVPGGQPAVGDPTEQLLARTWRPALSVIGADGLPSLVDAGNVLRPSTALRLSMRIPPRCEPEAAARALAAVLEADPPLGARVAVDHLEWAPGWDAPPTAPWLAEAVTSASTAAFGAPPASMGEGGTIPFMGMLGERFPAAQFLVIGVLGPGSNAHGPNEFLHVPMARGITAAVAQVLHAHRHRDGA
jgi:acetylornithine deacetylase/succinyl-diaminopimelate desuccinylase-like protein